MQVMWRGVEEGWEAGEVKGQEKGEMERQIQGKRGKGMETRELLGVAGRTFKKGLLLWCAESTGLRM